MCALSLIRQCNAARLRSRRQRLVAELERGAKAVLDLASEAEPRVEHEADFEAAIPALVGLLRTAATAGNAAWALSMLTSQSQSPRRCMHHRDLIHAAGAIEPLAALLAGVLTHLLDDLVLVMQRLR